MKSPFFYPLRLPPRFAPFNSRNLLGAPPEGSLFWHPADSTPPTFVHNAEEWQTPGTSPYRSRPRELSLTIMCSSSYKGPFGQISHPLYSRKSDFSSRPLLSVGTLIPASEIIYSQFLFPGPVSVCQGIHFQAGPVLDLEHPFLAARLWWGTPFPGCIFRVVGNKRSVRRIIGWVVSLAKAEKEVQLEFVLSFTNDWISCEWAYVVDLHKRGPKYRILKGTWCETNILHAFNIQGTEFGPSCY